VPAAATGSLATWTPLDRGAQRGVGKVARSCMKRFPWCIIVAGMVVGVWRVGRCRVDASLSDCTIAFQLIGAFAAIQYSNIMPNCEGYEGDFEQLEHMIGSSTLRPLAWRANVSLLAPLCITARIGGAAALKYASSVSSYNIACQLADAIQVHHKYIYQPPPGHCQWAVQLAVAPFSMVSELV
jgi:hypothetical protein